MQISKETVNRVAMPSRIKLDPTATDKMQRELESVVEYMEILNQLDTNGVEPLSHAMELKNVLREDEVKPSFSRDDILNNAPKRSEDAFVVPKAVE